MPTWERALVTGASSGLGHEFANQLAEAGTSLVLVARSAEALEELASNLRSGHGVDVEVLPADLVDPDQRDRVEARLRDDVAPVDLLVNNAGVGTIGRLVDQDVDSQGRMVELNVTAVVRLSQVAAWQMADRGRGGILNVSSLSSFQPLPTMATYAATKAAVSSFTEALHEEMLGTGVHVTALCPGFTRTSFAAAAGAEDTAVDIPALLWMEPPPVCRAGLDGVATNRATVVPGLANRAVSSFVGSLPGIMKRKVGRLANELL